MEVLHERRKDMKKYRKAGLHHAEFYLDSRVVEWGVYKWMMGRVRGQKDRARWDRRMRKMWNEWVALWGIMRKRKRRGRGAEAIQERVVPDRGERDKARPGILLCAPLGLKGPRGKVQSKNGQWYDVGADMFRRDNISEGAGQGDQCWRCTKEAGQVPWPLLRMTAWAFSTATMRTTDARGQWWGPVLRLTQGGAGGWGGPGGCVGLVGGGPGGEESRSPDRMQHSAGTAGGGCWSGGEFPDDGNGAARGVGTQSTRGPQVWGTCGGDQTDGPRVAGGQGMVPGSGTSVPGAGQGEVRHGMVSRAGADERLEGQDGQ